MLTKEEETLVVLMGYVRCTQKHDPDSSSWTNEPHWVKDGDAGYTDEIKKRLYGK